MPIIWDLMPSFDKEKGDYRYNKIRRRRNGAEYYWESNFGWLLRKLHRMNIQLQPFEKKLYEEHPATTNRSSAEVAAYRRANGISSIEARRDCTSPTCIEAHCWPIALTCRNFLGIAETGSHKTLAYVLPAVIHVSRQPPLQHADGPIAVVLAPTRELANQIHLVCSELGERAGVRSVCASNGEPKEDQYDELRKGCHICVATPRRLIEFLEEGKVNLRRCTYLVLDEVDRMLTMGFKPHVLKITELCRPDHQTIMWVTSWQSELKPFVEDLLDDYVEVKFGTVQLPAQNGVEMTVDVCQEEEKDGKLAELLDEVLKEKSKKAVVFTDTGRKADEIAWKLRLRGWSAFGLRGKKTKEEREWIVSLFRTGTSRALVTTDKVAHDLVLDNVGLVVNYDCPDCSEVYVRRSSHVARSGEPGVVHTFILRTQQVHAMNLTAILKDANQPVEPELYNMAKKGRSK
ncbi:probable ATP-dependent RNA helicase DDX5 [Dermacentor silvarum]|uniref:probable ATP-dependent RNA helicase DDX5 n=1 Tax=Dermacentor silvarum TaxID=543639 RepID=UPI001899DC5A|nr:probable ATP-dependent RNA helicase DDX5 [Dermacentor silvarum]